MIQRKSCPVVCFVTERAKRRPGSQPYHGASDVGFKVDAHDGLVRFVVAANDGSREVFLTSEEAGKLSEIFGRVAVKARKQGGMR